jgi:hypothetical protein
MKTFETYLPNTVNDRGHIVPSVFNGGVNIRRYKVTVEEIKEPTDVLILRLRTIWAKRYELGLGHSNNLSAMKREAKNLGIELD